MNVTRPRRCVPFLSICSSGDSHLLWDNNLTVQEQVALKNSWCNLGSMFLFSGLRRSLLSSDDLTLSFWVWGLRILSSDRGSFNKWHPAGNTWLYFRKAGQAFLTGAAKRNRPVLSTKNLRENCTGPGNSSPNVYLWAWSYLLLAWLSLPNPCSSIRRHEPDIELGMFIHRWPLNWQSYVAPFFVFPSAS